MLIGIKGAASRLSFLLDSVFDALDLFSFFEQNEVFSPLFVSSFL